jgi:hypothetical protein
VPGASSLRAARGYRLRQLAIQRFRKLVAGGRIDLPLQGRGAADSLLQRRGYEVVLAPVLEKHVERPSGSAAGVAQA